MNTFRKFRILVLVGMVALMVVGLSIDSADAGCRSYGTFHSPSYGYGYNCYSPVYRPYVYPTYNYYSPSYWDSCYNTWYGAY